MITFSSPLISILFLVILTMHLILGSASEMEIYYIAVGRPHKIKHCSLFSLFLCTNKHNDIDKYLPSNLAEDSIYKTLLKAYFLSQSFLCFFFLNKNMFCGFYSDMLWVISRLF